MKNLEIASLATNARNLLAFCTKHKELLGDFASVCCGPYAATVSVAYDKDNKLQIALSPTKWTSLPAGENCTELSCESEGVIVRIYVKTETNKPN